VPEQTALRQRELVAARVSDATALHFESVLPQSFFEREELAAREKAHHGIGTGREVGRIELAVSVGDGRALAGRAHVELRRFDAHEDYMRHRQIRCGDIESSECQPGRWVGFE